MRTVLLSLVVAASVFAADPFVGQWKVNLSKSEYRQGTPPREQIETITEAGGNLTVRVNAITGDGSRTEVFYSIPVEGGAGKMFQASAAYDGISGKHLGPREREISRWKDGKEVFHARSVVSPDGMSLVAVVTGVSPVGKPVEAKIVYDRMQ